MQSQLSYFEILGLEEPPKDRKEVKRAYSKKLKHTRPEDDPEGFMRLRDAHDIALNIIAHEAREAKWEAEQMTQSATTAEKKPSEERAETITQPDTSDSAPSLTYGDMLPEQDIAAPEDTPSETSYAIGPTPSLDAPSPFNTAIEEPESPPEPPLLQEITSLLEDPGKYNDREHWNQLFRNARQLDIDDYVDFEHLLLDFILRFHGYFDDQKQHFDQPERLEQKLSPSISASLFKTMNWDKVGKYGYQQTHQIEWLNRRMRINRNTVHAPTRVQKEYEPPQPKSRSKSGSGMSTWLVILIMFIVIRIIMHLGNL